MPSSSCRNGTHASVPLTHPLVEHLLSLSPLTFSVCSYRPSIALTFIADELAFQDVVEADQFLTTNAAAVYVEPTPAELAALLPAGQSNGKKKKTKAIPSLPLEKRQWDAKAAMQPLTDAIQKFRKVDVSCFFTNLQRRVVLPWESGGIDC